MKRTLRAVPLPITAAPDDFARDIEALAARMGGRAALIRHLSAGLDASSGPDGPDDIAPEEPHPGATEILLRLKLDADDLLRLDQVSRTTKYTRNRWAAALIHKALSGRAQPSSADRVNIARLVKELRRIEVATQRSARALADLEATARACLARRDEIERFRDQVGTIANALDEAFRGNDAYWRAVIDASEAQTSRPASLERSVSDTLRHRDRRTR